ncbi:alpha-1,2-mannosyltransferase [Saccharopolyspora lacisalsi]|uniref:Alpha-1,2-mannosyltransferase n=1 Tax=Halosaccharopolyspora lacisalsi TaxID=1000566 RepID=A0A839E1I5_9PSEU|nr:glycosyltransferase 87 family protein [Halosaccharopolyspora lacisalsi]MBA8827684.1 alpha-1,2-mannosyltransferase [Halosaccharopolyspora lacisalsi]
MCELIAVVMVSAIDPHAHIDGEVYQLGAQAWLSGHDIYQHLPPTDSGLRLPFIYPPFAAIVFTPLAVVPKPVAIAMIMVVTHLCLLATLYVVLRASTFLRSHRHSALLVTAALLPLATVTEPVKETITYAQINVVLMALVAVDCLWRVDGPRKLPYPRGLLIGLAAGLKLTPAAFLLLFLLRRDYRTIVTSIVTFLGTMLLGVVLAFDAAKRFWLHEVFSTSGVSFGPKFQGDASMYAGNQSVRALLSRMQVPEPWQTVIFGLLVVALLVLAVLGMLHALRRRDLPTALATNAVLGLLVSPISWSHHWVWAVPALVLLGGSAWRNRNWPLMLATVLVAEFFALGPHWHVPQGEGLELTWNAFEHFIGNAYVYFGAAYLLYNAHAWWRARHEAPARNSSDEHATV